MMRLQLILATLFVSSRGFTFPNVIKGIGDGRIVGGEEASITEAPWQVALQYDTFGIGMFNFRCGGSILSPNVIITAAHCIFGSESARWRVRAGSSNYNSGGQTFQPSSIIIHGQYNSNTTDYDIGLIILSSSIDLDGVNTTTIALPESNEVVSDGALALVTGWGSTFAGGSVVNLLRKVVIPIVNQQVCAAAYFQMNTVTSRMICAGNFENGGQDACQGDSGGPLVIDNKLIGVTSWGYNCAVAGFPGVWARVPFFVEWINEQLTQT